ncbi:Crp/Fnr family transcriptional regulator [Caenispirillum salinarum]|uniref:Crp/Fnr family transcriptional regulator n=1 Tax=Caenispirillum salinarum TaxID=859058 RepID=UPI00384C34C0
MTTADPFRRKLEHVITLPHDRWTKVAGIFSTSRDIPAGTQIMTEGEPVAEDVLVESGWATRERLLSGGERQVIGFVLPGDLSRHAPLTSSRADHTLRALSPLRVRRIDQTAWAALQREDPAIADAAWWLAAHDAAILKEHVVALGRRAAPARVHYLVWELAQRLALVGLGSGGTFEFPVSQEVLADAVGMTPRHLGRVMARLHDDGVIRFRNGTLTILDHPRLTAEADCRAEYLALLPGARARES